MMLVSDGGRMKSLIYGSNNIHVIYVTDQKSVKNFIVFFFYSQLIVGTYLKYGFVENMLTRDNVP